MPAHRIFMNPTTGSGAGWGGGQLPPPRHDATGQKDVKRLCVCTCLQLADSTFQSASFSTRKRDSTEASDLDAESVGNALTRPKFQVQLHSVQ